jgi:hypothetical protein
MALAHQEQITGVKFSPEQNAIGRQSAIVFPRVERHVGVGVVLRNASDARAAREIPDIGVGLDRIRASLLVDIHSDELAAWR